MTDQNILIENLYFYLIGTNNTDNGFRIQVGNRPGFDVEPTFSGDELTGVNVSNLGNYPHIPIRALTETIRHLFAQPNHSAIKGDAMNGRLGDELLPLDSVEGHIAHTIYGVEEGEYAFRRITPISRILEAAGVVSIENGYLILR